jgi:hypothetical protein
MAEKKNTVKTKRPSKSQRTHVRRLKQESRKSGTAHSQPVNLPAPK